MGEALEQVTLSLFRRSPNTHVLWIEANPVPANRLIPNRLTLPNP
jgi:hypothetical protein